MKAVAEENELSRLRWQCRRGMLELDLFLMSFLDKGYVDAAEPEKQAFQRLLKTPDQQLLELLMGREESEDREVADVINKVRATAAD